MGVKALLLPSLATLALAGCVTSRPAAAPAEPPAPAQAGTCGAEKVSSFVGSQASDEVLAKIKAISGAQAIRVVAPNGMMTMDYRLDRLTIETGDDGRIVRLRCI